MKTMTSREANQDFSRAKREAKSGPVIITERGRPANVLMTYDEYRRLVGKPQSILEQLAIPEFGGHRTRSARADDRALPRRRLDVTFLLDTNVVSEARRPSRLPKPVANWFDAANGEAMFVSVATFLEIEVGVRQLERRDPRQGAVLRRWKTQTLTPAFRGRVLPVDEDVADCCAAMQVPGPQPLLGSIIAATAIVHKLVLVTRNVADFAHMPVRLFNPWDAAN